MRGKKSEVREFMEETGGVVPEGGEKDGKDGNFRWRDREEVVGEGFVPEKVLVVVMNEKGKLVVDIQGPWQAREVRAIQLAVVKAYKRNKKQVKES